MLIAVKWRVERLKQVDIRCIHMVDLLVVLHALSRGRSSSRKMGRTIMRLNAYLLVSGLRPLWAYVGPKPRRSTFSARGSQKMGKKGLNLRPGHTKEERKAQRKNLGTLRSLTVQPDTRQQYQEGFQKFYDFLAREGLSLPTKRD